MTLVVLLTCQMCGAANDVWAKHCNGCGMDRAEMDELNDSCKEAEAWFQQYLTREPGDYPD